MKEFLCFQNPLSRMAEKYLEGSNPGVRGIRIAQGMDNQSGVQVAAREKQFFQRDKQSWPVPTSPPLMVIGTVYNSLIPDGPW